MDLRVANNDHDIGVGSKCIDKGTESAVSNLHPLKLRLRLATTQFELFYNVADLFKSMGIEMGCPGDMAGSVDGPSRHCTCIYSNHGGIR